MLIIIYNTLPLRACGTKTIPVKFGQSPENCFREDISVKLLTVDRRQTATNNGQKPITIAQREHIVLRLDLSQNVFFVKSMHFDYIITKLQCNLEMSTPTIKTNRLQP